MTCSVCSQGFLIGTSLDLGMDMEIAGAMMMNIEKKIRNYHFKALKFEGRCGTLYLHFTIPCLLSERRALCKDSRKKLPPSTAV